MTSPVPARPWLVLAGLGLGVCVTHGFARLAYGLLLPAMKSEMGWTYAQAGWLNTANALGYRTDTPGQLNDRRKRNKETKNANPN